MKFWTSLSLGFFGIMLSLGALYSLDSAVPESLVSGIAFVTQSNSAHNSSHQSGEYEPTFGDNWQSVRTFRLLSQLDRPIKVYVEKHPEVSTLYQAHYQDYIDDGLQQWSLALGNRLHYVYVNRAKNADITFNWVPAFSDRYVAGLTTYSVGHASVEIKTVGVPNQDIKCNIIHELGHALGISGHSNNSGDVMVGIRKWHRDSQPYEPKLSQRDVQAIRRLYSPSWVKGEDLFAANAQHSTILAAVSPPAQLSAEQSPTAMSSPAEKTTTLADNAALTTAHMASAQSRNIAPTPRYTQIFLQP